MPQGRGKVELFKSVRLMMAEGRFIQAERTLLDFSLQNEEELSIEFFHELFEVRRNLGKDFPFHELDLYFIKLAHKNQFDEINDLLNWWINKNPSFESALLYKWQMQLFEQRGMLADLKETLKAFGMFILKHRYWPLMDSFKKYHERYFKEDQDFVFILILQLTQTFQFEQIEKQLILFVEGQLIRSKKTPKTKEDLELLITILDQMQVRGRLEIWKSFLMFQTQNKFDEVEIKKVIESFIYFDHFGLQLLILRNLHHWGQHELAQFLADALKGLQIYDFVMIEKYFSHDLKSYFITKKKIESAPFLSDLKSEDLKLNTIHKKDLSREEEETYHLSEEEALIISGLKHQELSFDQSLDLMVSMLQMNLPLAARAIAFKINKAPIVPEHKLKLNYLLLRVYHELKDYRAGIDTALDSLSIAQSGEDIIAFMYAEADFHFHLGEINKAKSIYKNIISLVGNYRMAMERLKELDEI